MSLIWIFLIGIAAGNIANAIPIIPFYIDLLSEHCRHRERATAGREDAL
jgi:hypothetical protein